jgi:hypothetical protein
VAADAGVSDRFGSSAALSGDTALVGAFLEDPDLGAGPIDRAGSAYVFVRSVATWTQQAKLNAGDAEASDWFGRSVALSGDTALVGASYEDPDLGAGPIDRAGSAYVFVRSGSTWSQQAKLNPADAEAGDHFGSVALSGDTALIGAPNEDPDLGAGPIYAAGSAYVFVRNGTTWTEQAKLNAADAEAADDFGFSVALSGDTTLIGAYESELSGSGARAAYVHVRNGAIWSQQAKLVAADMEEGDGFGDSVAIFDHIALVGAPVESPDLGSGPIDRAGSVYVFVEQTFTDVPPNHWAWPYVEALVDAGLTAGYPDGTYRPGNHVIRAEIAVFLKKGIHGGSYLPPTPDGSHPFSDIAGHWAEDWIEDLYDEGFTSGFPDGTFRPQNKVTRAEMAVFILKAKHGSSYTPPAPSGGSFTDVAGHWAEAWIEQLKAEGITSGYPDGSYRPNNSVTRAEMAVLLVNTFSLSVP